MFRNIDEPNKRKFKQYVESFDWSLLTCSDVHENTLNFLSTLNKLYCECFPLTHKYLSVKAQLNPWFKSYHRNLIRAKSLFFELYKSGLVTKTENNFFKNRVKYILDCERKAYYSNLFIKFKQNLSKTWSLIRSLTSGNLDKNRSISKIIAENIEYVNNDELADLFIQYYSKIPHDLSNELSQSPIDPITYLNSSPISSMYLYPASVTECLSFISDLRNTKLSRDEMPICLLKENSAVLAPVICYLINQCFSSGKFPNILKLAVVTPIHKGGAKTDLNNLRRMTRGKTSCLQFSQLEYINYFGIYIICQIF